MHPVLTALVDHGTRPTDARFTFVARVDALAGGRFSNDLAAKIGDVVLANAFKDAITRLNSVLILG